MSDTREILRRGLGEYEPPTDGYERVLGRRDRRRRNQRIAAGALGVGVVLTLALALVRILNSDPIPADPPPAPSGGWVVYSAPDPVPGLHLPNGNATALYAVRPGEEPRLLVPGGREKHVCPSFSSDGSLLAYGERSIVGDGATVVVVAPFEEGRLGEPLWRFSDFEGIGVQPCAEWSQDGWLAMLDEAGAMRIVDPNGGITAIPGGPSAPVSPPDVESSSMRFEWSPDGTRIAVANTDEILIVRSGGDPITVALPAGARAYSVAWSPDGSMLLVGRRDRLWWISMEGPDHEITDVPLITDFPLGGPGLRISISQVLWSPHAEQAVVVGGGARRGLKVMTVEAGVGARDITAELPWVQSWVGLSPDGTRLLFSGPGRSPCCGPSALMAVSIESGELVRFPGTTGVVSDRYPVALAWQPVPSGGS